MLQNGRLGFLRSNPLGMTCQPFFRCIAACLAIADPDLVDGAAIFFGLGDANSQGEYTQSQRPVMQA
jgi:hypothetical protein